MNTSNSLIISHTLTQTGLNTVVYINHWLGPRGLQLIEAPIFGLLRVPKSLP